MRYVLDIPFWCEMEGTLPDHLVNRHELEVTADEDLSGDQIDLDGRLLQIVNRRPVLRTLLPLPPNYSADKLVVIDHIQLFCQNL